jgi:hypothetical protein
MKRSCGITACMPAKGGCPIGGKDREIREIGGGNTDGEDLVADGGYLRNVVLSLYSENSSVQSLGLRGDQ